MKIKSICIIMAALGTLGAEAADITFGLKVSTPGGESRKDVPTVVNLADKAPGMLIKGAKVVTASGTECLWQLDDLDGDGRPDELAFLTDYPGGQGVDVTVTLSETPSTQTFAPRTRAYIKLRDEKQKHPEVQSVTYPGNADLLDMYNSIYGHGAVMETEPVALRIYMDNRQSVDIYSKTTPKLELDSTGFYTTRRQMEQGYGCDILWAGKSVGAGSFRGYQNGEPRYVDTVRTRTQTVIASGPVRAIVDVTDKGWMYNGHPIDMTQRYTMWGGGRDVEVDVKLKGHTPTDIFCTGAQKIENRNEGFVTPDGMAASWGDNIPDKGAPDLVEPVGIGVLASLANVAGVKEDAYNYLVLLRPDADGRIRYVISFCGGRERGGYKAGFEWFEYMQSWH